MPKPSLREPYASLFVDLAETMIGGLHEWRSDLSYPESHSDLRACLDAVFRKYDIKLRPVPLERKDIWAREDVCPVCQKSVEDTSETLTLIQRFDDTASRYAHLKCVNKPKEQ